MTMKGKNVRRIVRLAAALIAAALAVPCLCTAAGEAAPFDVDARSAVLMEAHTGQVLYAKNADEALPPASVTKIMTLLLVMEAVDGGRMRLEDTLTVSEYAASMGGSQVYLEPGEKMTVEDLIKCTVISSANDAAVALAEAVCGTEEAFVGRMNERAAELGMTSTHFENVTGLDDDTTAHQTSALDIALMSRELLRHETILKYTTIWMDSIRDGAFGLTNTNRLIRYFSGATGLKTGSTAKAKFCISATAERDGMHLIAVIMGSPTRDVRNEMAKRLLEWGFSRYALYESPAAACGTVRVTGGTASECRTERAAFSLVMEKEKCRGVTEETTLAQSLEAPVVQGQVVGRTVFRLDGEVVGEIPVTASEEVTEIGFWELLLRLVHGMLLGK